MMRTDVRHGWIRGCDGDGDVAGRADRGVWRGRSTGCSLSIPTGWRTRELAEAMLSLRREQARLAAVVAEQTAAFEARQVYAEDGSRSATDWIAVHARLPRGPVGGEVRDARRLRSMPETRAAFRAGDLSAAHVRVLCRLAGHPRAGRHFPDGEAHLVGEGRRLRFDDWQRLCDYWRDAADPDGPEQRHGRDSDLRRFRIGVGLDGVGHADGYLTPVATAAVNGALARIERELFAADWAAAKEIHGDATTAAHLARTVRAAAPRRPGRDGRPGPDRPRRRQTAGAAGHGDGRLRHPRRPGVRTGGRDRDRSRRGGGTAGPRRDVDPTGGGRRPQPGARTSARPAASGAPCAASSRSCTGAATTRPASCPPTNAKATTSSPGQKAG